jgi:uncharacterized protein YdeI (YjbR/CyaY-like superfamily)
MSHYDPKVDAYIEKAQPFAQPILNHLRELIHEACPDVKEVIKWGFPNFDYNGEIMCNMAGFKAHATFGFWKASLMDDPDGILNVGERHSMGHFDKLTTLKDLPKDSVMKKYIKQAMKLTDEGVKKPTAPKKEKEELVTPDYLTKALNKNKEAKAVFAKASYSFKKEYLDWITDAKTEATRDKRMEQAVEWISEGKGRNWKYQR